MDQEISQSRQATLVWLLRIGCAGCFIGHGVFGLIGKSAWLPYFAVVGIGPDWAWRLMPIVGTVDILAGLSVLFTIRRTVLYYMVIWGLWTALLRPLSGDSVWEAVERAGNYGVPLTLLLLIGLRDTQSKFFAAAEPVATSTSLILPLRLTTALLFLGHGVLMASGKPLLLQHGSILGMSPSTVSVIGCLEIGLALLAIIRVNKALMLTMCLWKVVTEFLFILAGSPVWEFIERAGSYTAPLCLAYILHRATDLKSSRATTAYPQTGK